MIDLRKFAMVSETLKHPFSLQGAAVAAALRDLADKIDAHEYVPQGAMVLSEADHGDFHLDTLVLQLAPKRPGWISPEAIDKAVADLSALSATGALTPIE